MLSLLHRLLDIRIPQGRVVETSLLLRNSNLLGWALLAIALLGLAVYWTYRRVDARVSAVWRYLMAAIRIALLALVIAMLLQPVLRVTMENSVRRSMLLMLDASASMRIEDPRTAAADQKRAAIAFGTLDPAKGLDQSLPNAAAANPSRLAILQAVLKNPRLDLLGKLGADFDLRPFAFGQAIQDLSPAAKDKDAWIDRVSADSPVTPLGDDLREMLSRSRGQPLAGIVLATDGQSNTGSAPLSAAELARADGVPLYIYGVGLSNLKDIVVASAFAPEVCFVNDAVPVTVRVRGAGLEGQTGHVVLKRGDETLDTRDVTFDGAEQVVPMKFTPTAAGEFEITAGIDPRADEAVKDNNSARTHIRVIDGKIKVLLVDSSPRWEFKYLQAMLLRDRRVDLKCVLAEGDPDIADAPGSPYLKSFPTTKAKLFDAFDLLILGDVDPSGFSSQQMENIGEFVSKFGGGLLVVPGKQFGLGALRGSVIEKMLPVTLENNPADETSERPIKLELTAAGQRSTALRLSDDEQESQQLWAKLPPIFWLQSVASAKPAADVLLVDAGAPGSDASRGPKRPALAVQQYGLGQVMYLGTDNTWRWRKNAGDRFYVAFWGQLVQRLALPHLLGESKRTQLTSDKKLYSTGERVTVYARLYDEGFTPVTTPTAAGSYTVAGRSTPVQLRLLPDEPGMYRGEFVAPSPGAYSFKVDRDEKTALDLTVTEPKLESGETAMNEPVLREMAKTSGGEFFREEDLCKLPDAVRLKNEVVQSKIEVDLWASPIVFFALLVLMTAEWLLRKWVQLK